MQAGSPHHKVRRAVYYYVIGADGQRYGPADVDALVSWAREGRLIASTQLIERGTERQLRTDSLPALAVLFQDGVPGADPRQSYPGAGSVDRGVPGDVPTMTRPHPGPPMGYPAGPPPIPSHLHAGPTVRRVGRKSKIVAGLLGIFLGHLGIHRFYLGYTGIGILQIFVTIATSVVGLAVIPCCGIGPLWGLVEGIVCLCGGIRDADGYELCD